MGKIVKIEKDKNKYQTYNVTIEPYFIGRFFGMKRRVGSYRDTELVYTFSGGHVYVDNKGQRLGINSEIGERIDRFRRSYIDDKIYIKDSFTEDVNSLKDIVDLIGKMKPFFK